ncbi:MAG: hypothetical protein WBP01_11000 [Ferruginibacter sp.]
MILKSIFAFIWLLVFASSVCQAQKKNNAIKLTGTLVDGYSYYKMNDFQKRVSFRTTMLEYCRNLGKNEYSTWVLHSGIGYSKIAYNQFDRALQEENYNELHFLKAKGGIRFKETFSKVTLFYIDLGIAFNYGLLYKSSPETGVTKTTSNFVNYLSYFGGAGIHIILTQRLRFDFGLYAEKDLNKIDLNQNKMKFIKDNLVTSLYYAF